MNRVGARTIALFASGGARAGPNWPVRARRETCTLPGGVNYYFYLQTGLVLRSLSRRVGDSQTTLL